MPNNAPHNALRAVVNRMIANGAPRYVEIPAPHLCACLWQLADDVDAYGEQAAWFILTTPDGEDEIAGPYATEDDARAAAAMLALAIVPVAD